LYASLIGFHPRRLKVPTGDELPRNGLRSMRCLLLLLLLLQMVR